MDRQKFLVALAALGLVPGGRVPLFVEPNAHPPTLILDGVEFTPSGLTPSVGGEMAVATDDPRAHWLEELIHMPEERRTVPFAMRVEGEHTLLGKARVTRFNSELVERGAEKSLRYTFRLAVRP